MKAIAIRMSYIRTPQNAKFDFEKLPEGSYYFSGQEGFVKIEVDKNVRRSKNFKRS